MTAVVVTSISAQLGQKEVRRPHCAARLPGSFLRNRWLTDTPPAVRSSKSCLANAARFARSRSQRSLGSGYGARLSRAPPPAALWICVVFRRLLLAFNNARSCHFGGPCRCAAQQHRSARPIHATTPLCGCWRDLSPTLTARPPARPPARCAVWLPIRCRSCVCVCVGGTPPSRLSLGHHRVLTGTLATATTRAGLLHRVRAARARQGRPVPQRHPARRPEDQGQPRRLRAPLRRVYHALSPRARSSHKRSTRPRPTRSPWPVWPKTPPFRRRRPSSPRRRLLRCSWRGAMRHRRR